MASEFKVGGKCVALVTGTKPKITKGETYPVNGIRKAPCGCAMWLDVGIEASKRYSECSVCHKETHNGGVWWLRSSQFVPLEELGTQDAIDELLDKILESEKEKV